MLANTITLCYGVSQHKNKTKTQNLISKILPDHLFTANKSMCYDMPGKDASGQHAEAGGSCTPHRRLLLCTYIYIYSEGELDLGCCGDDGCTVGLAGQAAGAERGWVHGAWVLGKYTELRPYI